MWSDCKFFDYNFFSFLLSKNKINFHKEMCVFSKNKFQLLASFVLLPAWIIKIDICVNFSMWKIIGQRWKPDTNWIKHFAAKLCLRFKLQWAPLNSYIRRFMKILTDAIVKLWRKPNGKLKIHVKVIMISGRNEKNRCQLLSNFSWSVFNITKP